MKDYKTFEELIEEVKRVFIEHRLSLDEISKTYNVDITFLKALFNEDNVIISNLTKLIKGSNVRILTRKYPYKGFFYLKKEKYIYIKRNIHPECSIKFDIFTKEWYDLKQTSSQKITNKYIILDDFKKYKEKYIDKIN